MEDADFTDDAAEQSAEAVRKLLRAKGLDMFEELARATGGCRRRKQTTGGGGRGEGACVRLGMPQIIVQSPQNRLISPDPCKLAGAGGLAS